MVSSRQKMSAKLAGKHLLGFDTRIILADGSNLLRLNSPKVGLTKKVTAKTGQIKQKNRVRAIAD